MTDIRRPRLMVVDDNAEIQETLKTFFTGVGCDVVGLHSAEAAWPILTSGKIEVDVLILDWDLPGGMSGAQLNKKIKNHDDLKTLPVIYYTSNWNPKKLSPSFMDWLGTVANMHREGEMRADSVIDKRKADKARAAGVPHPGLLLNVAQKLEEAKKPVPEGLAEVVKLLKREGFEATDELLRWGRQDDASE